MRPIVRGAAICALLGYGAVQVLGRRAGSTVRERRMRLPGDDLVARPRLRTDHAVTIEAPPEEIWPWLTQLGWHLGGYYTPHGSTGCCSGRTGRVWTTWTPRCCAT